MARELVILVIGQTICVESCKVPWAIPYSLWDFDRDVRFAIASGARSASVMIEVTGLSAAPFAIRKDIW